MSPIPITSSVPSWPRSYPRMVRDFQSVIGTRRASRCSTVPARCRIPSSRASVAGRTRSECLPASLTTRRARRSRGGGGGDRHGRAQRHADRGASRGTHGSLSYLLQDVMGRCYRPIRSRPDWTTRGRSRTQLAARQRPGCTTRRSAITTHSRRSTSLRDRGNPSGARDVACDRLDRGARRTVGGGRRRASRLSGRGDKDVAHIAGMERPAA